MPGRYVVTVSVDQVLFRQPIHVGELVSFLAAVNHTGRSSPLAPCSPPPTAGTRLAS